ncbi:MAG: bestrophin family ion channel, partial [Aphanizomenon sp.]
MAEKKSQWFEIALQTKGSVISAIYKRVLLSGIFGVLVSILYHFKIPVSQ